MARDQNQFELHVGDRVIVHGIITGMVGEIVTLQLQSAPIDITINPPAVTCPADLCRALPRDPANSNELARFAVADGVQRLERAA